MARDERTWILTGSPENYAAARDPYPWRFATEPEIVVPEEEWIPAESLADELDHVAKWPREHWTLAFAAAGAAAGVTG